MNPNRCKFWESGETQEDDLGYEHQEYCCNPECSSEYCIYACYEDMSDCEYYEAEDDDSER